VRYEWPELMHYRDDVPESDEARRKRLLFTVVWWVALVAGLVAFRAVLVPFVLAVVIAYVLSPVARAICQYKFGSKHPSRWAVVLSLYLGIIAVLAVTTTIAIPALVGTVRSFVQNEIPRLHEQYRTQLAPKIRAVSERFADKPTQDPTSAGPHEPDIRVEPADGGGDRVRLPERGIIVEREGEDGFRVRAPRAALPAGSAGERDGAIVERVQGYITEHTGDVLRFGSGIVGGVVGGVFRFFITLMLSAYILLTEREITAFFRSLVHPRRREAFNELLGRLDRGLSGVVRGQLAICLVNGLLSGVGFAIAKLPYWPLLTAIATVFSLIPIFGAFLSSIPAVILGLRTGVGTGVFVLTWIVGIHQLEANLLNPKILGDAAKIHPVLVVFSLLAGEHFFGIMGALLAVPTMSVAQSLFLHWRKYALGEPSDTNEPSDGDDAGGEVTPESSEHPSVKATNKKK
jgi:predicted PurR-regulated permease PerM